MAEFGSIVLLVGIVVAAYAAIALVVGGLRGYNDMLRSGRTAAWGVVGLTCLAVATLITLQLQNDFSVKYVTQVTQRSDSWYFKIAAMWSGMEGSLLLWALILCGYAAAFLYASRNGRLRLYMPWVLASMMIAAGFFLACAGLINNVFARMAIVPQDGQGLNPLLRNPAMIIHPPMLYAGYVGTAVPFGFALAALVQGRSLADDWVVQVRRWLLVGWLFLTIGNFLGGQWAYVVLGWGGYWGWDPVENAAIMPWFVATALLHSIMIQQRRGMFKIWNLSLAILTYTMALFGTFLTRSGIVASSSVHAFGESTLFWPLVILISALLILSFGLVFMRLPQFRADRQLESLVSRETSFVVNNILLLAAMVATLGGTMFPFLSRTFGKMEQAVDTGYYNKFVVPILLMTILLMGIGPLVAWRKASTQSLARSFWLPASAAIVGAFVLFVLGVRAFYPVLAYAICIFAVSTVGYDYVRGIRARMRQGGVKNPVVATRQLVARNRPRYGGLLVHVGIVVIVVAIIGSTAFKQQTVTVTYGPNSQFVTLPFDKDETIQTVNGARSIRKGEKLAVGDTNILDLSSQGTSMLAASVAVGDTVTIKNFHEYRLTLRNIERQKIDDHLQVMAYFDWTKDGVPQSEQLKAGQESYPTLGQPVGLISITPDPLEDLYMTMQPNVQTDANGAMLVPDIQFVVMLNPLMIWAWIGLALTLLGFSVAVWPNPVPVRVPAVQRIPEAVAAGV